MVSTFCGIYSNIRASSGEWETPLVGRLSASRVNRHLRRIVRFAIARIDAGDGKLAVEEWKCGEVVKLVDRIELPAIEAMGKAAAAADNTK